MVEITAALVKALRDQTGAGMMDCKKALIETDGAIDDAVDWLRTKGLAAAAKKAGRTAAEGLVGLRIDGGAGALVEVNSETDFVARNDSFQKFVDTVAVVALQALGDREALAAAQYPETGRTVAEELKELVAALGENMRLRRTAALTVGEGIVAGYVHNKVSETLGKIGVLVALESTAGADALAGLGKQLAMHVAAARPEAVTVEAVDQEALSRERAILAEQAAASGKPPEIVEKMVEGRLRKYYEEVVLLEQLWVIDGETKVAKVLAAAAEGLGGPIRIAGFARFTLGEGIAREASDFAADVAAQLAR